MLRRAREAYAFSGLAGGMIGPSDGTGHAGKRSSIIACEKTRFFVLLSSSCNKS